MPSEYEFDVALSFAGENRVYVRAVAEELKSLGIQVFFDEYKQVDLWGKDLYEHLHDVYSKKAQYCVIFISKEYSEKNWTTHERRSAQERALHEKEEYILPARFDDTALPGMSSTIGYINLNDLSPLEFAHMIAQKMHWGSESTPEDNDEDEGPYQQDLSVFLVDREGNFVTQMDSLHRPKITRDGVVYRIAVINNLDGSVAKGFALRLEFDWQGHPPKKAAGFAKITSPPGWSIESATLTGSSPAVITFNSSDTLLPNKQPFVSEAPRINIVERMDGVFHVNYWISSHDPALHGNGEFWIKMKYLERDSRDKTSSA